MERVVVLGTLRLAGSLISHLDLSTLCLVALWQGDGEHAVLVLYSRFVFVHSARQRDRA